MTTVVLLTVFCLTRLYRLLTFLPPFLDETIYIRWLTAMHQTKDFLLPLKEFGWEPLNTWVAYLLDLVVRNPLLSLRLTAVFFGLLSLFFLNLTLKNFLKNNYRLVALLFYLLSPIILLHDRLGLRGDSAINFCFSLAFYGLTQRLVNHRSKASYLIALSIILGLLTKTTAVTIPLIVVLSFLWFKTRPQKQDLKALLLTVIPPLFYLLTGTLNLVLNKSSVFLSNQNFLLQAKNNFMQIFLWLYQYLTWPVILLFAIGAFLLFKPHRPLFKLLLISLLVPIIFMGLTAQILFPRYILLSYLPMTLIAGYGFSSLLNCLPQRLKPFMVIFLIPCLVLSWQVITNITQANLPVIERWQYIAGWPSGYGLKELTDYLKTDTPQVLITENSDLITTGLPYLWPDMPIKLIVMDDDLNLTTAVSTDSAYLALNVLDTLPQKFSGQLIQQFLKPENHSSLRLYKILSIQ